MNKIFLPVLLALTLSACGTTPDTRDDDREAGDQDRSSDQTARYQYH